MIPPVAVASTNGVEDRGIAMNTDQWPDIEVTLQSFLQNDLQLADMLDTFEASPFDPADASWGFSEAFHDDQGVQ